MARYVWRTFGCSGVSGKAAEHSFEIMVARGEDGEPDEQPKFCPKCGAKIGNVEPIPGTHSIGGSAIQKAVDGTYRLIEARSEEVARITGNPGQKITNMRDHLREGDVAMMTPRTPLTDFMDRAEGAGIKYGFGGGMMADSFRGTPAPVAVDPETGFTGPAHSALSAIQGVGGRDATRTRQQMIRAGTLNKGPQQ